MGRWIVEEHNSSGTVETSARQCQTRVTWLRGYSIQLLNKNMYQYTLRTHKSDQTSLRPVWAVYSTMNGSWIMSHERTPMTGLGNTRSELEGSLQAHIFQRLACYAIIGDAQGAISSTKRQHVTRITCCDWGHTFMTRVILMRLVPHIGDVICDWSHKYVTGDAICIWRRNCATAPVASPLGDMLIRIAYIADHLGLIHWRLA
jgi:hypothetical protein